MVKGPLLIPFSFIPLPSEPSIGIESGPLSIRLIVLEASFVNEFAILGKANGFLLTGLLPESLVN